MNRYFSAAQRIYDGEGSLQSLRSELARHGCTRPVVISGGTLHRNARAHVLIERALGGKPAQWFSGVRPHSPVEAVRASAQHTRSVNGDCFIALGGGSAMVTARATAIILAEGDDFHGMATHARGGQLVSPRLMKAKLPIFVVPTVPSTAIAKAGSAVLEESTRTRLALYDPKTRAAAVFLEPELLMTADIKLASSAAIHLMGMAIEGILSSTAHPLSDASLGHSLYLTWNMLLQLKDNPENSAARTNLALAAVLCGQGTDHAGGGVCSAIDHAIGARLGISNGACHAVLLPVVLSRYDGATLAQVRLIAGALGLARDASLQECVDVLAQGFSALGYAHRLRDLGVPRESVPALVCDVKRDWFAGENDAAGKPKDIIETAW